MMTELEFFLSVALLVLVAFGVYAQRCAYQSGYEYGKRLK